jgi:hypothetical protein
MKVLLAGLIGFLIGVACTVAYYEFESAEEEDPVITDQPQGDRSRPIRP